MIQLPQTYSPEHQRITLKYLTEGRRALSMPEWKLLLTGFDLLHKAMVIRQNEHFTFTKIYKQHVEQVFADQYIAALLRLQNITYEHEPLRPHFARQIVGALTASGVRQPSEAGSNLLVAYCLYFWESFAAGYAFEVEIYRDLSSAGVAFVAHDIRNRLARFSPYDLEVLNLQGDIKSSLYFLEVGRGSKLPHDFYITRFYEGSRQRTLVVMLQVHAWKQIDGETILALLAEATKHFPLPVQVELPAGTVVVDYDLWKQKVLRRQAAQGDQR